MVQIYIFDVWWHLYGNIEGTMNNSMTEDAQLNTYDDIWAYSEYLEYPTNFSFKTVDQLLIQNDRVQNNRNSVQLKQMHRQGESKNRYRNVRN